MRESCIGKYTFNSFTEALAYVNNTNTIGKEDLLYNCPLCGKVHMKDSLDIWLDNLDMNSILMKLYTP